MGCPTARVGPYRHRLFSSRLGVSIVSGRIMPPTSPVPLPPSWTVQYGTVWSDTCPSISPKYTVSLRSGDLGHRPISTGSIEISQSQNIHTNTMYVVFCWEQQTPAHRLRPSSSSPCPCPGFCFSSDPLHDQSSHRGAFGQEGGAMCGRATLCCIQIATASGRPRLQDEEGEK